VERFAEGVINFVSLMEKLGREKSDGLRAPPVIPIEEINLVIYGGASRTATARFSPQLIRQVTVKLSVF
jgi:hypothetical protein